VSPQTPLLPDAILVYSGHLHQYQGCAMFNNEFLHTLSQKAASLFPAAEAARSKLEKELYMLLQTSLGKLHLVTREEFDAQREILARANERIADLEQRIDRLEKR
jgi:ubiquinone biosynthesis accessory factor UbiK